MERKWWSFVVSCCVCGRHGPLLMYPGASARPGRNSHVGDNQLQDLAVCSLVSPVRSEEENKSEGNRSTPGLLLVHECDVRTFFLAAAAAGRRLCSVCACGVFSLLSVSLSVLSWLCACVCLRVSVSLTFSVQRHCSLTPRFSFNVIGMTEIWIRSLIRSPRIAPD